jgi:cellulose synthase/poly-beta-1,6-N-acetylglucosamine synthase-like glycosyltransferase
MFNELVVIYIQYFFTLSIIYYFYANSIYLFLLILAFRDLRKSRLQSYQLIKELKNTAPAYAPAISILAPAYNEGKTIIASIKSFLLLNYPNFEVVVINDGSKDDTLEKLIEHFKLYPDDMFQDERVGHAPIRTTYKSLSHPNLTVIDKENGGKADAINAGLALSKHELFCAVDSDSVLESDALLRIALPFFEDPDTTIASGGTIRLVNGSDLEHGRVKKSYLSRHPLILMQNVEYIRAFLCGRVGWNALNATLVISGAFGLFNKEAVLGAGSYNKDSIGEDMELVVRLHRHYTDKVKRPYRIVFIPDPVCWTEAPFDLGSLSRQRVRWQRGLADALAKNSDIFHYRYKALGLVAVPYFYLVELWGPVIELVSWSALIVASCLGILNHDLMFLFFLVGLVYSMFMTLVAILLEELYFRKTSSVREFFWLMTFGVLETFGFRQLTSYWRIKGLWLHMTKKKAIWGEMKRSGLS